MQGAVERGAKRVRVHILTDGRDVPDGSSIQFVTQLEQELKDINAAKGVDCKIASGGGRMYVTMDRYEVRGGTRARRHLVIPLCLAPATTITATGTSSSFMHLVHASAQADWAMVKRGWDAHVLGKSDNKFTDALTAVKTLRVSTRFLCNVAAERGLPFWGWRAAQPSPRGRVFVCRAPRTSRCRTRTCTTL